MRPPIKFKSKEKPSQKYVEPSITSKHSTLVNKPTTNKKKFSRILIDSNEILSDFELYVRILKDKLYKYESKLTKLDYLILAKLQTEKDFLNIVLSEGLNLTTCNNNLVKMRKLGLITGRRKGSTFFLELRKDLNIELPSLDNSNIYIITKFKRLQNV